MQPLHCELVTPGARLFEGEVWQVTFPGPDGRFSVRSGHAPVISAAVSGIIEIARSESDRQRFTIADGLLEVSGNRCLIIAGSAEGGGA